MDTKVLTLVAAGFAGGVFASLLVGLLLMNGMMSRAGMMRGWGWRCTSTNPSIEIPLTLRTGLRGL
ncbi:hypothetical protein [Picosynechococcus sp. NKBG15041c]|uniref:hypothetical protein n=1 Tax=Picosynechococcus sp. NKBG15041c TaxID=1407650 RepID=UPI0011DC75B2|nr:hypothetical protein [Picosynechococcus sp. NKBG15041c]